MTASSNDALHKRKCLISRQTKREACGILAEIRAHTAREARQLLRDAVRALIKANLKTEQNPEGLLTNEEREYLACLEMQHRELEVLFAKDDAHWQENLDKARNEKSDAKDSETDAKFDKLTQELRLMGLLESLAKALVVELIT